jgi:hypothetical protein
VETCSSRLNTNEWELLACAVLKFQYGKCRRTICSGHNYLPVSFETYLGCDRLLTAGGKRLPALKRQAIRFNGRISEGLIFRALLSHDPSHCLGQGSCLVL